MCQRRSRLLLFPLYMESSGNYVDVCYREEGNIVNVNKIMNINGNAQGYRLNLEDTQQEIPVSRTYLKDFKSFLNKEN